METKNINVQFNNLTYAGYAFADLPLHAAMIAACQQIDDAADAARSAVVGDPLRALEYERAAAEARAYAAAEYKGIVPPTVKSWADAAGMSARNAADDIVTQAAAWDTGLYTIRDARLKAKAAVKAAVDHAAVEVIATTAIGSIRAGVATIAG